MTGFIDLHCHWVAGIDDGATTPAESLAMLRGLHRAGFDTVIATPHMRPGLFDNEVADLRSAYESTRLALQADDDLPEVALSSEHYFDDVVFQRLMTGQALPYPGDRAVLIEFHSSIIPTRVADRLFDLRRKGLRPVIAHPERCTPVWRRPELMEEMVDRGIVLLMDVGALTGKYGRSARKCAEDLLERGLYYAVSSDAHSLRDVDAVVEGIAKLRRMVGDEEAEFLLIDGPRAVLDGKVDL